MAKTSIDDMKALLDRRGGIARGNRYEVMISHPYTTKNVINDPAEDHRHQVGRQRAYENSAQGRLDRAAMPMSDFLQGPEVTYMLCTSVSLPGKRISTTENTADHNLAKKPYSMATDEVTMTFLLTGDYYIKKYFDMWMNMVVDSAHHHYKTMYKKDYVADIEIRALQGNEDGIVGYGNLLENAYPIQMSQVELSNASDGLMELTITWEYDNWRALDIDKGFKDAYTEDKWTHPGERTSGAAISEDPDEDWEGPGERDKPHKGEGPRNEQSGNPDESWEGPGERESGKGEPFSGDQKYDGPGERAEQKNSDEDWEGPGERDSGTKGSGPRNEEAGVEVPRPGPRTSGQGAPFSGPYRPERPGPRTSGNSAEGHYKPAKRANRADYSSQLSEKFRKRNTRGPAGQ